MKVLTKKIRDVNVLMPRVETIQTAVGVLFEHREVHAIELKAIVVKRSEDARAEIVIGEEEAAKIGNERLNTGARRNKVEVFIHVRQFHFAECLFQREVRVRAIGAAAHVDIDDAIFTRVEVIRHAESRRNLDGPVARLETRIAMKELKAELNSFV